MEHTPHEPQPPRSPRPCSTPHSAPVGWLRAETAAETASNPPPGDPSPDPLPLAELAAHLRSDPEALAEFVASLAPEGTRGDGWTPFARKLFLEVLANTGRVGLALEYAGLSKQSANALRNRDPLFAAGWDAAALMARNPLADDILEKGIDGVTDTIIRGGEVVAERHRYDGRLSMAVLHRLDKRCDRAEELGSNHLALVRRWDEWLDLIGKGDEAAARAILESGVGETSQHGQLGQLPLAGNPTEMPFPPGFNDGEYCWKAGSSGLPGAGREHGLGSSGLPGAGREHGLGSSGLPGAGREHGLDDGVWLTVFPPPPGFDGYENRPWDGFNWYERACTAEEVALLDAHEAATLAASQAEIRAEDAEILADAEAQRDALFLKLKTEIGG
jgi:hypothetical protein